MGKCCSKGKVLPGDGSTDSAKGVMQRPEMKRMAPEDRPVFKTGITDDYTFFLNEPLGRGSFGIVFKAKGKDDDKTYAVKCVQKSAMTDDDREDLFREVKIMGLLGNSLNIVYLYDAYEDEQNYYLVMEYCSGGQLFSRVKRFNRRYNEARVASLMRSILQVCAQCHSKNIIYRDVKPENFLFLNDDPDSPIKATDFGLAVHKPPGTPALKLRAGTPAYMAPEVVNRDYGKEADIWSCGVIAYQLLTGRFPFRGTAIPTYASRKVCLAHPPSPRTHTLPSPSPGRRRRGIGLVKGKPAQERSPTGGEARDGRPLKVEGSGPRLRGRNAMQRTPRVQRPTH
mmetsp:Transcript_62086/g.196319  ORF Transcript_62086/g.196319 Transcript_62086/m.196319 type:complete len:340 (+) Transcript_62086:237-1256(+)